MINKEAPVLAHGGEDQLLGTHQRGVQSEGGAVWAGLRHKIFARVWAAQEPIFS